MTRKYISLIKKIPWSTSIFWVIISAFFITIFANFTMFAKANAYLIGSGSNQLFMVVLVLFQFLLLLFFMSLLTMHKWHRHMLAIFYFVAAFSINNSCSPFLEFLKASNRFLFFIFFTNPLLYRLSYLVIWNFTTKTVKKRNYSKNADFYRVLGVNSANISV